jgi:hypothetical protein
VQQKIFQPIVWVYMITLPLVQPTIVIQFFIILNSFSHRNPPLNIDLPIIFILLISYNITFNPSHPNMINYKVWRSHKNKITNKQVTKRCVCNNVQRKAHAFRPIVWNDDKIFKVNINNGTNGSCTLIISSPIAIRPKVF